MGFRVVGLRPLVREGLGALIFRWVTLTESIQELENSTCAITTGKPVSRFGVEGYIYKCPKSKPEAARQTETHQNSTQRRGAFQPEQLPSGKDSC